MEETPYVGWLYIALMVASVAVAGLLLAEASVRAWAAAGLLAAAVLIGFVLSRTSGLPDATGDVGNWSEGLGLASMFVEACVLVASGVALALLGGLQAVRVAVRPDRMPHAAAR